MSERPRAQGVRSRSMSSDIGHRFDYYFTGSFIRAQVFPHQRAAADLPTGVCIVKLPSAIPCELEGENSKLPRAIVTRYRL